MRAKRSAAAVDGSAVVSSSSATAPSPPEDPSPRQAHIASTRYTNFAHPPASLPPPSWMDSIAEDSFAPQPHRSKEVNVGHSIAGQSRIKKNGGKVGEGGGVWFGTGDASQLQVRVRVELAWSGRNTPKHEWEWGSVFRRYVCGIFCKVYPYTV